MSARNIDLNIFREACSIEYVLIYQRKWAVIVLARFHPFTPHCHRAARTERIILASTNGQLSMTFAYHLSLSKYMNALRPYHRRHISIYRTIINDQRIFNPHVPHHILARVPLHTRHTGTSTKHSPMMLHTKLRAAALQMSAMLETAVHINARHVSESVNDGWHQIIPHRLLEWPSWMAEWHNIHLVFENNFINSRVFREGTSKINIIKKNTNRLLFID